MSIAVLIRDMAAAGAPPEAIAIAVEAIEDAYAKVEEKRAVERDRKRRQRAASRDMDGTVTGQSRDSHGTVQDKPSPAPFFPPNPQSTPTPTRGDTPRARKADPFQVCPVGVDPGHWRDFLANRKAKRLTNSETAYAGVLRSLADLSDDLWPPGRLVQHAAEKGWGSINHPKDDRHGTPRNTFGQPPTGIRDPILADLARSSGFR